MKRVCKQVDITDRKLIERAVYNCFATSKKRKRTDTIKLFQRTLGCSRKEAIYILKYRSERYDTAISHIVELLREKIVSEKLDLSEIHYEYRKDAGTGKIRKISILSIYHLLLDHVVVVGLEELAKRIGQYQVSSIPNRGASYGKRAIERWLLNKKCKYAVKLDIKDFYGSVNRDIMMNWLRKRVKNPKLLWLTEQMLRSAPEGISIGSYLSQTIANIYLSDIYHFATEQCVGRRNRNPVKHALFYMDDMLFLGFDKRQLRKAIWQIIDKASELGLRIKPNWNVFEVQPDRPVDMMGYRFSYGRTTLRKRVFKSARRSLIRFSHTIRKCKHITLKTARRMSSYHGYLITSDSAGFIRRHHAVSLYKQAFNLISYESKLRLPTAGMQSLPA